MAKVDTAKLAEILGQTDNAAFQQAAANAVAELERQLGYPLCGTTEAEERIFNWTDTLWHRVHPLYEAPASIVLVRGGSEETVTDFQLGQNGRLFGDWFNAFKLCNTCQTGYCRHCPYDRCDYIKVTAKWGFGAPELVEESGEPDSFLCYLPDDLYNVLVEAVKASGNKKGDIQSENTGTRSYSKFAASYKTVWEKYGGVIDFYRLREPRF